MTKDTETTTADNGGLVVWGPFRPLVQPREWFSFYGTVQHNSSFKFVIYG